MAADGVDTQRLGRKVIRIFAINKSQVLTDLVILGDGGVNVIHEEVCFSKESQGHGMTRVHLKHFFVCIASKLKQTGSSVGMIQMTRKCRTHPSFPYAVPKLTNVVDHVE